MGELLPMITFYFSVKNAMLKYMDIIKKPIWTNIGSFGNLRDYKLASKYWIKLYHEILDDPKMSRLSDRLYRRTIEIFLLAGDFNEDGATPPVEDMAWRLRMRLEELETDLADLAAVNIVQSTRRGWIVTNFDERQKAITNAERMRKYRDRKRQALYYGDDLVTDSVTKRNTDIDIDIDKDKDKDSVDDFYRQMRDVWSIVFSHKPQPKPNTKSIREKIGARMKNKDFMDNWRDAMVKAAKNPALQKDSWFNFKWLVNNDDNYQKLLDGYYDWKMGNDRQSKTQEQTELEKWKSEQLNPEQTREFIKKSKRYQEKE